MSAQLQLFQSREATDRWVVRVSQRARRLSVRVYPGGRVEVVVPPGASASTVQRFVGTHRQWIDRRIEDLSAAANVVDDSPPASVYLPAIARRFTVDYRQATVSRVVTDDLNPDLLHVCARLQDTSAVNRALRDWVAALAHDELGRELRRVAAGGGFSFSRVQIRRQRTRWGSCSVAGTISLNVCLMFLEPRVVRYLLIHELCHTRHMNHSQRFWSLVRSHEPDFQRLDRELLRGWQSVPGWMFS
jgi:predicted metal-dependent hydrolase